MRAEHVSLGVFLQWELQNHGVFTFLSRREKYIYIYFFRPWPTHHLDCYCSLLEVGCALSKHPASCQHSATRGGGGGCVTQKHMEQNQHISCCQMFHRWRKEEYELEVELHQQSRDGLVCRWSVTIYLLEPRSSWTQHTPSAEVVFSRARIQNNLK